MRLVILTTLSLMVIIAPLNSNHFMVRVMATVLNDTVVITLSIKAIKKI